MCPRHTLLVIDDEPDVVRSVQDLARLEYRVLPATSAAEGMCLLQREPVQLIMTDQRMPGMTGVEFLHQVRGEHPDATRLLFTGYADIKAVIDAINQGSVYRYITKPWDPDDLLAVLRQAAHHHDLLVERKQLLARLRAQNEELERANADLEIAYDTTLKGWSEALELRDQETQGHTERVTKLTLRLARNLGLDEAELVHVRRGALLHDIGKMGIPDGILLKPGPLNPDEWTIMRRHPVYAYELLRPIPFLGPALAIPYCHHERWDGTGYPRGLKGEEIPLAARIFAVVDTWDALCSDRPYHKGWPAERVRDHLLAGAGTHFDPRVVEAFLRVLDESKAPV